MKDLKHLIYFEDLLSEANNELVKQASGEGKLALGYTCYFVPEVLLNLGGCFSVRLRAPGTSNTDIGTYYMTNKTCPFTRSILERSMEGGYNFLSAMFSSETCQMMHRAHEYFDIMGLVREQNPKFFMSMMDVPLSPQGRHMSTMKISFASTYSSPCQRSTEWMFQTRLYEKQ